MGHTFFHAIHQLQVQALQLRLVAQNANHRRLRAGGKVRPLPQRSNTAMTASISCRLQDFFITITIDKPPKLLL